VALPYRALTSSFTISRQLYWEQVVPTPVGWPFSRIPVLCGGSLAALVVIKQTSLLLHQEKTENGVDLSVE